MQLARRVLELEESATLAVTARAAQLKSEGVGVISFGAGEPDFDTPAHIKQAAIRAMEAGQTRYSKPASGLPATKAAVCAKFLRENRLRYAPDQVIITSGGKMAVYLAIEAVVDPGDEVVIPRPYWVSFPEIVRLAGGIPVFADGVEDDDFKLSADDLRSVLSGRTRAVIFNSPSNPSGVTYTPDEIRGLAAAIEDRDVWVISDEIYDRLVFDGQETISFAAAGDAAYARTITINAASKTYAMTGWRMGYAAGPRHAIAAMAKLQSQMTSGGVTFNQIALAEALNADQQEVERMRREFQQRARIMHQRLTAIPGVRCPRPTGAFYCFPNVSSHYAKLGVSGSVAFAERLLDEARVAVVPGVAFGMDGHVRLSFAVSTEQIDQGLRRIEQTLR